MSAVVAVDLSTHYLDLVKLDEDTNHAEWVRCPLVGDKAWDRTLNVRNGMVVPHGIEYAANQWWDDVYLVAIEAPMGHRTGVLDRIVGAVASSLPAALRVPHRCWLVHPQEWKAGLGLKGKPTWVDLGERMPEGQTWAVDLDRDDEAWQNFRDAYCLAMWARDQNATAVA